MKKRSTIDSQEIAKFAQLSQQWWNPDGPLKTLHDINPPRLEFMKKYVDFSGKDVLDVGCGGGILSEAMARKGATVTGLDVEADAIEAARSHAIAQKMEIKYVCQPIESFETKWFDMVICMEMLEHVTEPQLVIDHCARFLKPGGYLFLSTLNRTPSAYAGAIVAAEYLLELLPRQTHDYNKFIKPSELAAMVRKSDLEVEGISGLSYNPFLRKASLHHSVSINYLMACRREA